MIVWQQRKRKTQRTKNQRLRRHKGKKARSKNEIALYSFIGVLAVVTVLFAYNVISYFYIEPTKAAGKPQYGDRLDGLVTIDQSIINDAQSYGSGLSGVQSVNITVEGIDCLY